MKEPKFKVGDHVRLKGHTQVMYIPKLTIDEKGAYCAWSDSKNKVHKGIYSFSQLELIFPSDSEVL